MKVKFILSVILFAVSGFTFAANAPTKVETSFLRSTVHNVYKYRADGKPGRLVVLRYDGAETLRKPSVLITSRKGQEQIDFVSFDRDSIPVLLNPQIGLHQQDTICAFLFDGKKVIAKDEIAVPALRHWRVFVYPHSHVDIGYTNTQQNVAYIHKNNLDVAMQLCEKTKDYPEGSRFRWNPEVTWPVYQYMTSRPEAQKQQLLDAIKKGYIAVDASFVNTNTSACNEEELLKLFSYSKYIEHLTGMPVQTFVQVDIPGMSWGLVPAARQNGVKYCLSLFNGGDRVGNMYKLNFKPFWWIGPDKKSKLLFLQPGSYNPGALIKGKDYWPKLAGQLDSTKLIPYVKTDCPRANFIDQYFNQMIPELEKDTDYIYDIFPMSWAMADNTPVDVDLPEAVRSWNEEFAYPHIQICSATEMMQAFEAYGERIPTRSGDMTEYWTDGLGTAAKQSGKIREVKDRLIQAEILWSMLRPTEAEPAKTVSDIWRNINMSTEHTWAYMNPNDTPIQNRILARKFKFFDDADSMTQAFLKDCYSAVENKNSNRITVFNTDSWKKSGLVTIPDVKDVNGVTITDSIGNTVNSQVLKDGSLVILAENVPAFGSKDYFIKNGKKTATVKNQKSTAATTLYNGIVAVTVDSHSGDITSLNYEGKEYVNQQAMVGLDSYRYLEGADSPGKAFKDSDIRIRVGESGPLVNSLIIESNAKGCNSLKREVIVTKESPEITFIDTVDKQDILAKEGIHFGFAFDIPSPEINVNIPWGMMTLGKDQIEGSNINWIQMQRWLNISNSDRNVTLCPLNAGTFEVGDLTANILGGATKSPLWIGQMKPSATVYSWAMNNHWHTNFQLSQSGIVRFEYSVLPSDRTFQPEKANQFAINHFRPLIAVRTRADFHLPDGLHIEGSEKVVLSNYITTEGGKKTVRFYSFSDEDEPVTVLAGTSQKQTVTVPAHGYAEATFYFSSPNGNRP